MSSSIVEPDEVETLDSLRAELGALREQNSNMYNILINLPEQFYWLDLEGRIVTCNERQASYFGMKREEFIGINVFDLAERLGWDREVAERVRQNDMEVMAGGQRVVREEEFEFNGEHKTFISYKYPLYDGNKTLIGIFGLSIDITDRKKMELDLLEQKRNAETANMAKTHFLMNISHDIRTPFSGIIGNSEILLKQESSDQKKEILNEILASSHYLLELLDDIIDAAKLEGKYKTQTHAFDLIQSIEKMAKMMQIDAKKNALKFELNVSDDVPRNVMGDRKSIERILLNLLGNAIKFTPEGSVNLSVRCLNQDSEKVKLEMEVSDTGIGIPDDKMSTIFDRFSRLSPNYVNGSGLGLWIVKGLVEQLGGEISVKSQLNQGTQFTIKLDLSLSTRTIEGQLLVKNGDENEENCVQSILLIEDNPVAQKVTHYMLSDFFNAQVDLAQSAKEALNLAQEKHYDLILMDIELPDASGSSLAAQIKQKLKHHKHTLIIGLSAHTEVKTDSSIMPFALATST
jgi:PAS domain S-box-containing protein